MALPRVNVVVVGAGAGGGIAACVLAEAGLRVVLLERGHWMSSFDDRKDDLRNQRTTVLGHPFGPDDARNPRVAVDIHGAARLVMPSVPGYCNNAACVGGGTLSYGAMAWRFHPDDFRMKSVYGHIDGGTLEDWPLGYDDLEPFYEQAEWEIGVSGDDSANPFKGPRRKPLPMPPLAPNREYQILKPAALRLGLHPFDIPMLRNSIPYQGRGACMRCRWCVGFACEIDAKNGAQNTVIPRALATKNCELRTGCTTKEILTDAAGKVTGVSYFDGNDRLQDQPADVVVVACAAVESARLLLNSRHRLFPNGLGNRYDWVGRNLQGHTYTGAMGLFEQVTYDDVGPGAGIAVSDFNHGNKGLVGGGVLCNEFIRLPYQFAGQIASETPRWGAAHKDFMRRFYRRSISILGPTQEVPSFECRMQLDPKVRDYWGLPVARLSGRNHPKNIETGMAMAQKAAMWLKEAGATRILLRKPGPGLTGGQHQAGTCRMGRDPKTSVVDAWGRVHDFDKLYVMDGSVHVTNGGFNPVLTIMALAYRNAAHLARTWRHRA